ncbi:MAG: serpin family protein [Paludibacteraceae bacterium]|nr:serpin family protein [Paludibacteraceae bacterium]
MNMKHTSLLSLVCTGLLALSAGSCNNMHIVRGETPDNPATPDTTSTAGIRQPKQLSFNSTEEQLLYRTNEFSMNMLSLIGQNEEDKANICFSPLSASMALGMMMNGADGDTYRQMQRTLGFEGATEEDINSYYHQLLETLPAIDTTTVVNIANALWLRQDYPFYADYKERLRTLFNATIDNVDDFRQQATIDMINQWAADHTNNLIKEIISPESVSENTVMILANALYFKGIWEKIFDKKLTRKGTFTTLSNRETQTDMMHMHEALLYTETEEMQMVELDYKDREYCMDILLPRKGTDMNRFLDGLTLERWENYLRSLHMNDDVWIQLPKFKFSYNRSLTEDLQKAGITDAFLPLQADFSRLSERMPYIDDVSQFCYISVDEESTEAAAVTVVLAEATSSGEPPLAFVADHPFVFVIREKQYGTILFTGIVGDPTQEE